MGGARTWETVGRVGALVLLLAMVGDWYTAEAGTRSFNAWEAFPKLDVLLALAALAGLVAGAAPVRWAWVLRAGAGGLAAATILLKWASPPAYTGIEPRPALFAALLGALAIAAAGVAQRRSRTAPEPAATDEPARGPERRGLEALLVAGLVVAVAVAVYADYVDAGGLDTVGWAHAAMYRNTDDVGFLGAAAFSHLGYRPMAAPYLGVLHGVMGLDMSAHVAWAITLAVAMSVLFYVVLRMLGLGRAAAAAAAVLVLVFPASSTARFGTTHSIATLSVVLYLAGLALVLHGFRLEGRRALPWHAAGWLLFALTLLTYEITVGPIVAGLLLYRVHRGAWRPALRRWVWDVVAVGLAVGLVTLNDSPRPVLPLDDQIDHARLIAEQGVDLGIAALVPFGNPPLPGVLASVLVIGAAAIAIAARRPRGDAVRRAVARGLAVWVGAALLVATGYAPFVATDDYYSPLQGAEANRVNTLPALGYVLLLLATAWLAAVVALSALRRWRLLATVAVVAAAGFAFVGYLRWQGPQERVAVEASREQRKLVSIMESRLPRFADDSTLFLFGSRRFVAEGTGPTRAGWTVFGEDWDLSGALRLVQRNPTLRALPVERGDVLCEDDGAYTAAFGPGQRASYEEGLVMFDAVTGRVEQIHSRSDCAREAARMKVGDLLQ